MTCVTGRPTFRLLDPLVGWDPASCQHLSGCDDAELRLAPVTGEPGADPAALLPYFGDRRLARGCGPCEWYLLPPSGRVGLLRMDGCQAAWQPGWPHGQGPDLADPVAVAAHGHLVAVADRATRRVLVWGRGGQVALAELALDAEPVAVAIAPWREVLVAVAGSGPLRRFSVHGQPTGATPWPVPAQVEAVAFGRTGAGQEPGACPVLLLSRDADGALSVWLTDRNRDDAERIDPDRLGRLVEATGVVAVGQRGFCLAASEGGLPVHRCWSWWGRPLAEGDIGALPPRELARRGQLLTRAIDSGIPRCPWHRLWVDADVPEGTTLRVDVATGEDPGPGPDRTPDPGWEDFETGVPHPADWQRLPPGTVDALIDRPPGRYLFVRVRLVGDGARTPVVHAIRLDFPRVTSLEHLPGAWREDPAAEDFTARFLALFDAGLERLDRVVERYPALLDPAGVPDAVLPWLAGLIGLGFDPAWSADRRRALLRAAPELFRRRGTPEGLRQAVQLVLDVVPVIEELGPTRAWGALGRDGGTAARLGAVRLFGPSRVRFRLDRSMLSRAPIRSLGDPERDAHGSGAYRFRVLVPPGAGGRVDPERLRRLVDSQAPAHTVAELRLGGTGLVIGQQATVGVDTALVALPAPVLGGPGGTVRLGRRSVVWPGRRGRGPAIRVGDRSVVGVNTVVR